MSDEWGMWWGGFLVGVGLTLILVSPVFLLVTV